MNVGMPPRSRNQRLPAACEAPTASAASSLLKPRTQRRLARRLHRALPVNSSIHPAGLPISTSTIKVLRGPVEPAQYLSGDYTQTLADHDVLASVGSTGDAYDHSMAESFVDSFKTELIAERVWRSRSQLELAIVEYISWFNDSRLHENLGDRSPAEIEELYAVKTRTTVPTS
jgi:Integrase core domain